MVRPDDHLPTQLLLEIVKNLSCVLGLANLKMTQDKNMCMSSYSK